MSRPRIVITGMGVTSVLGNTIEEYWSALIQGRSGIRQIRSFDAGDLPCQIAGEIDDFDLDAYGIDRKTARRIPRSSLFALSAAIRAMQHAGLPNSVPNPERGGVCLGTAMGGIDFAQKGMETITQEGYRKLSPFIAGGIIPNFPAYLIGKQFQCLGPNATLTTACAASTQAIGEGAEFIRRGVADIVIVGGTEAFIRDFGIGGFSSMRALPTSFNDNPTAASRPFDAKREGFVLSEGAAILILENLEHAKARGAKIFAEFVGHASSADGYHIVQPDPDSSGKIRAMNWALKDAGISSSQIDYINAHGTSTPLNDLTENNAIKDVFGKHAYELKVSSTKSMLGHAMGASGALEAIACIKSMQEGAIPPTINIEYPDPECDLDYSPNSPSELDIEYALSNSFGLGGQNACVILKKYRDKIS